MFICCLYKWKHFCVVVDALSEHVDRFPDVLEYDWKHVWCCGDGCPEHVDRCLTCFCIWLEHVFCVMVDALLEHFD